MPRALPLAALSLLLAAAEARAEPPPPDEARRAEARELATRGDAEFYAGRCERAVPLWQRAEDAYHAPTILLRIARCQVAQGALVAAAALLERVAGEAPRSGAPPAFFAAREEARRDLAALKPRLASLAVAVHAREGRPVVIEIDGVAQPAGATLIAVDPGERVVRVRAGASSWQTTVTLAEGERRRCDVALWADADPDRPPVQRTLGLGALAAGAAVLAVGVGLSVASHRDPTAPTSGSPGAADATVGLGGALMVGGALLLTTAPRADGDAWRVRIAASPAALTLRVRF
jgi:hypothetical protein